MESGGFDHALKDYFIGGKINRLQVFALGLSDLIVSFLQRALFTGHPDRQQRRGYGQAEQHDAKDHLLVIILQEFHENPCYLAAFGLARSSSLTASTYIVIFNGRSSSTVSGPLRVGAAGTARFGTGTGTGVGMFGI